MDDNFARALVYIVGPSGLATIIAAYFGWRKGQGAAQPQQMTPVPIQIESPWMIQNLLQQGNDISKMKDDLSDVKHKQDALMAMVSLIAQRIQ